MGLKKTTLSQQIFLSMIGLISFALFIIAIVNIKQIQNETRKYNTDRLSRKDRSVAKSIEAIINLSPGYNVNLKQAKFVESVTSRATPLPSYFFKVNNFVDC